MKTLTKTNAGNKWGDLADSIIFKRKASYKSFLFLLSLVLSLYNGYVKH